MERELQGSVFLLQEEVHGEADAASPYKVGVPLRTQGWICSKLANVTIKDGRCDGLQFYKAKGAACSQRFFDCMNELVQKVIQEETK